MVKLYSILIMSFILSGNFLFPFSLKLLLTQIGLYLFNGCLLNLILEETNIKLALFWLPAMWSEKVLDWIK